MEETPRIQRLISQLVTENGAHLRVEACEDLITLGVQAVPDLVEVLGDDRVGNAASDVLAEIGRPSLPHLADALGNRRKVVRLRAAYAMLEIDWDVKDDRTVGALSQLLKVHFERREQGETGVATVILNAIKKTKNPKVAPIMVDLLNNSETTDCLLVDASIEGVKHLGASARDAAPALVRLRNKYFASPSTIADISAALEAVQKEPR